MVLYMEITEDEYELPVAVATSATQLARLRGVSVNSIRASISHENAGRRKFSRYKRVEVEDD